jgi:redox-regulated HSP33 family molecular chaperone
LQLGWLYHEKRVRFGCSCSRFRRLGEVEKMEEEGRSTARF